MSGLLKILYLGDIVGRPAREFIAKNLRSIKALHNLDIVIANAENATSGMGLSKSHAELLHSSGVDLITLGDHVWDRRGFDLDINDLKYVCRPANLSEECPGRNFLVLEKDKLKIGVCVSLGRQFMKLHSSCPIKAIENLILAHRSSVDVFIAEVHAEATSEKVALGWYFDGRVSALVGTHTHVQTADEQILPKGTAYITDLGMCGAHESVIGREITPVLYSLKTGMPQKFEVASNDVRLNGAIISIDKKSGLSTKISRFCERF